MRLQVSFSFLLPLITFSFCDDAFIWNIKGTNSPISSISEFIGLPSVEHPLVVFLKEEFNIGDLSLAGDVYSTDRTGGNLKHFKELVEQSKGYSVLNVASAYEDLRDRIESQMNPETIVNYDDETSSSLSGATLIYVELPDDLAALDVLAPKIIKALNKKDYTAVLVSKTAVPLYEELLAREKRAVGDTTPTPIPSQQLPWIYQYYANGSQGNCIFLAQSITLVNRLVSNGVVQYYVQYPLIAVSNETADTNCPAANKTVPANMTQATIALELAYDPNVRPLIQTMGPVAPSIIKTHFPVYLVMKFQMTDRKAEWNLIDMRVYNDTSSEPATSISGDRSLNLNKNAFSLRSVISGQFPFSYVCSRPDVFWSVNATSPGEYWGISFTKLRLQMYGVQTSKITGKFELNRTYDSCSGFFTPAILMGIICVGILLLIIFFGICMISNLKTMDRFDDPKQKPLVISFKE